MRIIGVSTAVFARIWALREHGEETENAILQRVLGVDEAEDPDHGVPVNPHPSADYEVGYLDPTYRVEFPEGLEIFRVYKGVEYRAVATKGAWRLKNDGRAYPSLHKLSKAVVSGNENSWRNWRYDVGGGRTEFIDELRDQSKVIRRFRPSSNLRLEDL